MCKRPNVYGVSRDLWCNPDLPDDPFSSREALIWLIGVAAWSQYRARGNAGGVTLNRGEFSFATRFLAEKWKWSKSRVDRYIKRLAALGIIRDTSRDGSKVYLFNNYNRYQVVAAPEWDADGTAAGQTRDADGTAAGQDRDKEETGKKQDNIKDLSSLRSDRCKSSQPHSEPQPQPKPEPELSGIGQSQPAPDAHRPVARSPAVALRVIDGTRPVPGTGVPQPQVRTRRGSRWPDDALVPDDWLREGEMRRVEHGLPMVDVRLEAEKFQNHWSSSSGQSAIKVDWHKTWINWVLRANSNVRTNGHSVEEHPARTAARRILAEMYGGGQA